MSDISMDLYLAYEDGYKKGKAETEAYLLHCGDETPITNADRIRAMTDEELARLFYEHIDCGTCKYNCYDYESCNNICMADADCLAAMLNWLKQEVDDEMC